MEDLYLVLECEATASAEILKQHYQRLVLKFHPDKVVCDGQATDTVALAQSQDRFIKVQHAYKILGDAGLRAEYDARWQQRCIAQDWPVQDEIDLSELEEADDGYVTSCRCGGEYCLSDTDVSFRMDFVQCSNCSLCIRILYEESEDSERLFPT